LAAATAVWLDGSRFLKSGSTRVKWETGHAPADYEFATAERIDAH
jgi:hypothetical protein